MITKSKYIPDTGYAVLDEFNSDDIINAVEEEGIFDTTLGLLERERRSAIVGKGHDTSKIMFGEAKEGAVEAHNFSSSMSITTIHYGVPFKAGRGVTQGGPLSAKLFNLLVDAVAREWLSRLSREAARDHGEEELAKLV